MSSRSNKPSCSRSSSVRPKLNANSRLVSQTTADARLHIDFESSEQDFNYSNSVNISCGDSNVPSSTVSSYLRTMQRGKLIQPFGCIIAVDEKSFTVLAYSENAPEMLDLIPHAVPSIGQKEALAIGSDARMLFRSTGLVALQKAATFSEVNLLNPILVHCRSSGKPFYAILHRVDIALVIDLEPVNPDDIPVTAAGALKSYKLAAKTISKLQSLPTGNISLLCDVLVHEVSDLTGYDRVMVYKFHEDEHGEVVAEYVKSGLEPYLGLHYPATDIPQASRFLFMRNKVRMICDCSAKPAEVIQDRNMRHPLSLCGSTLRAPHGCHAQYMQNMGSIASLVMSVTVNEIDDDNDQQKGKKLWGLVVCHHSSPRFLPFPFRYACEFMIQVFGIQINKEIELEAQSREKHILRTQTVLCDMLLRDAPIGIVNRSPNIMDLVKCDGAALYYRNKFWLLGVTPTENQITDIISWLHECHDGSTGLSTDSLIEGGYPGAYVLGEDVCGMAAISISPKDFLFWFRSHSAKEIKWGGAKHDPTDKGDKMHPRSSFKAFLEVIKRRSIPWEDVEMDAIHSLQLILRETLQNVVVNNVTTMVPAPANNERTQWVDELRVVTTEIVRLIETALVPIFAVDYIGNVNGWNSKAEQLTGLTMQQAISMPLIDIVENDSVEVVQNILGSALQGEEEQNIEIKLKTFGPRENDGPIILIVNACCSRDLNNCIVGICFVGQDITGQMKVMDKYTRVQGDYTAIVQNPSALIPPIFIIDKNGRCTEWNESMQKLTGLKRDEAVGRMLLGEVFSLQNFGCRVKDQDTITRLRILINGVLAGQDGEKLIFGLFDKKCKYMEVLLSVNTRLDVEGKINGVLGFLHIASPELQHVLQVQRMSEEAATLSLKELSYIRREIRNPLQGITFTRTLLEGTELTKEQKQLIRTSTLCEEQLAKILDDVDLESIEDCYLEMNTLKFNLGEAVDAIVMQGMALSTERNVQIICDIPNEVSSMYLYGDNLRLQQIISDFLTNAILFTPIEENAIVTLEILPRQEKIGKGVHVVHLEFRIAHPAPGVPAALIQEMFCHSQSVTREGLGLYISQKLVKIMNGTVQYLREAERSSFIVLIELPLARLINKS